MTQLAREVEALAARAPRAGSLREAAHQRIKAYRRKQAAYAACFCDDEGHVTEAGRAVLADLAKLAGLGVARAQRSTEEVQFDEGQRRIVLHLIEHMRLDEGKLARLARQLREANDE